MRLTSHPAVAKALGMVSAPVPTIRLNMYTSPTWNQQEQSSVGGLTGLKTALGDVTTVEAFQDSPRRREGRRLSPEEPDSVARCWEAKHWQGHPENDSPETSIPVNLGLFLTIQSNIIAICIPFNLAEAS